jgi:hypothetical protein
MSKWASGSFSPLDGRVESTPSRGPEFDAPGQFEGSTWNAQRLFYGLIQTFAPQASNDLMELGFGGWQRGYHQNETVLTEDLTRWANRYHMTQNSKPSPWAVSFARDSIFYWMAPGAKPSMVRIPDVSGEPPMAPEECQIKLPLTKLAWSPFTGNETRAEAQERIRRLLDQIVEDEFERIRTTAVERGGVRIPKKRDTQPFEWAVRFQVNEEAAAKLARSQPEQHTVHAAINSCSSTCRVRQASTLGT